LFRKVIGLIILVGRNKIWKKQKVRQIEKDITDHSKPVSLRSYFSQNLKNKKANVVSIVRI